MESRLVHGEEEGVDVVGRALQEAVHGVEGIGLALLVQGKDGSFRKRHVLDKCSSNGAGAVV
jgi:hypothetical protein